MRIAYITAGAGGMYCGSCLHDNTLAGAMQRLGHDVALVPLYTPIRTDEKDVSLDRIFFGAINVYLEQKSALFRHTPWAIDRWFNSPKLLAHVVSRATTTDPRILGELTLSMLRGEQGRQRKELERLIVWLRDDFRPEIVHLSNSMLSGLARRIRAELEIPVVCSLQGEDLFVEEMTEPYRGQVRRTILERSADIDGFIANSHYYLEFMKHYLDLPAEKMHVVGLGVKTDGYDELPVERPQRPFTVGYLARICPEKGLHLLVDALRLLSDATKIQPPRLRIAGYLGKRDQPYFDEIVSRCRSWGMGDAIEHVGEVDRDGKIDFLSSLDLLCVPTIYHEPKGLFVLEALAAGVPVVQPRHGAFPELIEATGGGVLVDPDSAEALAAGLGGLMADPERCRDLGLAGRQVVRERFNERVMAEATLDLYRRHLAGGAES